MVGMTDEKTALRAERLYPQQWIQLRMTAVGHHEGKQLGHQHRQLILPVELGMADALLQRLNTAAECRLQQTYRLGGAVKTIVFDQREKIAQLAKIEMYKLASQGL